MSIDWLQMMPRFASKHAIYKKGNVQDSYLFKVAFLKIFPPFFRQKFRFGMKQFNLKKKKKLKMRIFMHNPTFFLRWMVIGVIFG